MSLFFRYLKERHMKHRSPCLLLAIVLVLACQSLQAAGRGPKEFFYKFDSGGVKHGFKPNVPQARVVWAPGGAMESLGSLESTGDIFLERFGWFQTTPESELSFHFKCDGQAHGYLNFRLNFGYAEERKTYGYCGLLKVDKTKYPFDNKWRHVRVKMCEITGVNKGAPTLKPGITFKSLTIRAGHGVSKLALDNIRMGPPMEEKDIFIKTRNTAKISGNKVRVLLDFEGGDISGLVTPETASQVKITASDKHATRGKGSAKIVFQKGHPWPTFEFTPEYLKNWQDFDYISFDIYCENDRFLSPHFELQDHLTTGYATRCGFSGSRRIIPIHKGKNRIVIDLSQARRNGKEGLSKSEWKKEDVADLSKLTKLKFWIETRREPEDVVTYIDNIRLLQAGALESNMKIDMPASARAFDFGEDTKTVDGFTEANLLDIYGNGKEFGFYKPEGLRSFGGNWPDPLSGDCVGGGFKDEEWQQSEFDFRVRVENGKYLVYLNAGYYPIPNIHADLEVNGQMIFSTSMKGRRFYSQKVFHRHFATEYSEKPNALWKNFINVFSGGHTTEAEVENGELYVKGANSFLGSLVIMPAAERKAFEKLVAQIQSERARFFYKDLYLRRYKNEPCVKTDKDLVFYHPAPAKSIMPWTGVGKHDNYEIDLLGAGDEALCFQVGIRPFRDFEKVELTVSDLKGPDGARIRSKDITVYLKKYRSDGQSIQDWTLMPRNEVALEKGLSRAFWLRFRIPEGTRSGLYKGSVRLEGDGVKRSLPIKLDVQPFSLEENIPMGIGFWYNHVKSGQFALYKRVKGVDDTLKEMQQEQAKFFADFGCNAMSGPTPGIVKLVGSSCEIDLTVFDEVTRAFKKAGMLAHKNHRVFPYILSMGRSLSPKLQNKTGVRGISELDQKGFATALVSAVRQTVEFCEEEEIPVALYTVDEPRENPNPWNRNLKDTIRYLKILKQIKGAPRMVTPMGDMNHGVDYTPMCDHLEILATHPTYHSKRMIKRAMSDPKMELWLYNAGQDRISNGFYSWRVGATAKFEWHANTWDHSSEDIPYKGRDLHFPTRVAEGIGATVNAPLKYNGGLLPRERLLTFSQGVNDYRYIHTLQVAVDEARAEGHKKDLVASAEKLFAEIKSVIPVIPKVKGLEKAEDLAEVGTGIGGIEVTKPEEWKRSIASLLARFSAE